MKTRTVTVPVSDPAHPSHVNWLQIIMAALTAATSIGPAIVAVVDPADAPLADGLGKIASTGIAAVATGVSAGQ